MSACRRIPHAKEQLSSGTTTTQLTCCQLLKPMCLQPVLHNKRSHCNEKPHNTTGEHPSPGQGQSGDAGLGPGGWYPGSSLALGPWAATASSECGPPGGSRPDSQRRRLSWACVLCPSRVRAAQVMRCLASAVAVTYRLPAARLSGLDRGKHSRCRCRLPPSVSMRLTQRCLKAEVSPGADSAPRGRGAMSGLGNFCILTSGNFLKIRLLTCLELSSNPPFLDSKASSLIYLLLDAQQLTLSRCLCKITA